MKKAIKNNDNVDKRKGSYKKNNSYIKEQYLIKTVS